MTPKEATRQEDGLNKIRDNLILILAEESGMSSSEILDTSTLDDLGIGKTIGSGEFLELKEKIERHFGVEIPWDEVPPSDQAPRVTVERIATKISKLLSN